MPDAAASTRQRPCATTSSTAVNYTHHVCFPAPTRRNWGMLLWQGLFLLWAAVAFRHGWVGFDSNWDFYIR